MAWKVIGFMEGKEGNPRYPQRDLPVYGPLPRKVWVRMPGEKPNKKWKPKAQAAGLYRERGATWREITTARAIQYTRWLAARDKIALPDTGKVLPLWGDAKRISAVIFGPVRVDIPNWNWEPAPPVEDTVSADIVLLDMYRQGLALIAQAA